MPENYLQILNRINSFFFDVDGVLTDGSVTLMPGGEQVRVMNVKDGYVLQLAVKMGYNIAIITGGKSQEVKKRLEGLGIQHVYLGASNKLEIFKEHCEIYGINPNESLYMGDDIPDFEVMKEVSFAAAPNDAAPEIKSISNYISPEKGGHGCVRDIIEKTMRVQKKWFKPEQAPNFENFTW